MSASVHSICFVTISPIVDFYYYREDTLQDVPEVEIESNWDQVVDK